MNEYETASLTLKHIDVQMMEDLKIFTSNGDGMRNSFANVKVKWIFVLKTNNDWAASQSHMALKAGCCVLAFPFCVSCFAYHETILFMMFKFSIDHYYKLTLNGMSTVVRSDDAEVLLCIICSSPFCGFYIILKNHQPEG
ncbi:hypothetical protein T4C_6473 [Trichinella pseudospiralis]|uniref:Uncharacterized protein n=1 Tax=Trichinella pseudospiralis TaxID=6337 RepID=A0A0V1K3Y5_TRIPS|nr:hypothetical protein T4C_6473 [Trichinella pseudospiralis]